MLMCQIKKKTKKKHLHIFALHTVGAEINVNLWWFVDAAVVSEVLLFGLHVIHGFLLGPVLKPGDGPADPLQQLEAEGATRRNRSGKRVRRSAGGHSEQGPD